MSSDSFLAIYARWHVDDALHRYPGLSLQPTNGSELRLRGDLEFIASYPEHLEIEDAYEIEIRIPKNFPAELPAAIEVGGRIPKDFHTNCDKTLCLGSEVRQRLLLGKAPTLCLFLDKCVVPFLYGYSHKQKFGDLPFGELSHGTKGIIEDYMALFRTADKKVCIEMLSLAAMKKRSANKRPCPCGSGRRLGKCHNRVVNRFRDLLGRKWFAQEHKRISGRR